ncbi:MAG: hypothetical protein C0434_03940 [Xanthomonadaceae bacterium]|nr:hypothetical protein [Xanthomonadaceae bacterium]
MARHGYPMSGIGGAASASPLSARGLGMPGKDFSSCWSALPSGIRQRLEPMLATTPAVIEARRSSGADAR